MGESNERCALGAQNKTDIENLVRWQKAQNGKLDRIEQASKESANRTNIILGGVIVTTIGAILNFIILLGG